MMDEEYYRNMKSQAGKRTYMKDGISVQSHLIVDGSA
jgi:hypothetical protein